MLFRSPSFLWDTIDSILHSSPGFMLHGVACLAVFGFSFVSLLLRARPSLEEIRFPLRRGPQSASSWVSKRCCKSPRGPCLMRRTQVVKLVFYLAGIR